MKSLTYSPDPRNKLLSSQSLIHSAYYPAQQIAVPYQNSIHLSPMTSHKVVFNNLTPIQTPRDDVQGRRRSNSQVNFNNIPGFSNQGHYLKSLENKIRMVIDENDRLLRSLDEKNIELQGFQQLESKVRLLLEENEHMHKLLKNSGKISNDGARELPSQNSQETSANEDLVNKMTFLMQENEKLEGLLDSLQENFRKEMENYQQETENKIMILIQENKKPKLKLNAEEKAQSIKKTFALKKSQYLDS